MRFDNDHVALIRRLGPAKGRLKLSDYATVISVVSRLFDLSRRSQNHSVPTQTFGVVLAHVARYPPASARFGYSRALFNFDSSPGQQNVSSPVRQRQGHAPSPEGCLAVTRGPAKRVAWATGRAPDTADKTPFASLRFGQILT